MMRPSTAPYNFTALNKLRENQRSVQYLRNPFGIKSSQNNFVMNYPSEFNNTGRNNMVNDDGDQVLF